MFSSITINVTSQTHKLMRHNVMIVKNIVNTTSDLQMTRVYTD